MIPYNSNLEKAAVIIKHNGGLTPEKLLNVLEGSDYVSVDLNEDESKVVVELDETKLDTTVTEDSDNLITSGAVYEAVNAIEVPVTSVNGETGAVVLSASDILATNTQSVQANLERIDTEVEGVIDDVADLETEVSGKQDTLTAGSNISISGTTISATDTTYTAGTNVAISAANVISATDTTYTASTGINISAANAISYLGTVLYATFDSSTGTLNLSTSN